MLISPVIPMISVYRLPHGQYGYSEQVINSLPRHASELDVVVIRKETSPSQHHDFCVLRSVVFSALKFLTNNKYFVHMYLLKSVL